MVKRSVDDEVDKAQHEVSALVETMLQLVSQILMSSVRLRRRSCVEDSPFLMLRIVMAQR